MRFLLLDSVREIVSRVEHVADISYDTHNYQHIAKVVQLYYQLLHKTNQCMENIYYKYILKPSLLEIIEREHLAKSVVAAILHLTKKGQTHT